MSEGKTEGLLVSVYLFIFVISELLSHFAFTFFHILPRGSMRFRRCLFCHHYMGRKVGPRHEYRRLEQDAQL